MPKHASLPEWEQKETRLAEYRSLAPKWHDWKKVAKACADCATAIFERACVSVKQRKKRTSPNNESRAL
jgi:hypothetical protein